MSRGPSVCSTASSCVGFNDSSSTGKKLYQQEWLYPAPKTPPLRSPMDAETHESAPSRFSPAALPARSLSRPGSPVSPSPRERTARGDGGDRRRGPPHLEPAASGSDPRGPL